MTGGREVSWSKIKIVIVVEEISARQQMDNHHNQCGNHHKQIAKRKKIKEKQYHI